MTTQKQLKARIRERMARTGERYLTARRHVLGARAAETTQRDPAGGYVLRGGTHPDTASIANALANHGVRAEHSGEPLSEAMVLGIGGGLGAGYILWEFKAMAKAERQTGSEGDVARILVLGFRNAWQYPQRWVAKAFERLGVPAEIHHTQSRKAAAAQLDAALAAGRPALATVDRQLIGYWHLPEFLEGHLGYPVVVYGLDGDRVRIDDRNLAPLTVDRAVLDGARARVPSYKNRLVVPTPSTSVLSAETLREAALTGLRDQVEHLSQRSDSFGLPAWRKWSRMLTNTKNAKGWPTVFADRRALTGALLSTYEGIEPLGLEGGHLRALYADFLDEAAELLELEALSAAAREWRTVAELWHELADAAVPLDIPEFAELRDLLAGVYEPVVADGDAGAESAARAARRLWELRATYDAEPPLEPDAIDELLHGLAARLEVIFDAETEAVARLGAAVPPG